jgi:MraZ protein
VFYSHYTNPVDAKGRVSVPADFRARLGDENQICAWQSAAGPFLQAGGKAMVRAYEQALSKLPSHAPSTRAMARATLGRMRYMAWDSTGRIVIPAVLGEHMGLTSRAVFVGVGPVFEIWDEEVYLAQGDPSVHVTQADWMDLQVDFSAEGGSA